MSRAIVLVSGGMDSLVCTAIAMQECEQINFLHFNYGQRTQAKELECFEAIVQYYQPKLAKVVEYPWLLEIGGSALTDNSIPMTRERKQSRKVPSSGVPNTYVPFRNAMLLCAAVAWAEVIRADRIYIGAVEEDSSGYPDCRQAFFRAFEQVVATGTATDTKIEICTPVIEMSKADIVKKGIELNAPFQLSWSCYTEEKEACGLCDSCRLRMRAFRQAGFTDPIKYGKLQTSQPAAIIIGES